MWPLTGSYMLQCYQTGYLILLVTSIYFFCQPILEINEVILVSKSAIRQWDFMAPILEPRHDKTNNVVVRPAKTQISLGIRPVWSESSLFAWRHLGSLATYRAHSEDSDQTGRIPRLTESSLGEHSFRCFCHVAAHLPSAGSTYRQCRFYLQTGAQSAAVPSHPDARQVLTAAPFNTKPKSHVTVAVSPNCRPVWLKSPCTGVERGSQP